MSLRGRCIICTATFTQTTVFALPCGHTFHGRCIGTWLKTPGHGCPNCRRKFGPKDVTRIFFDIGSSSMDDTSNMTTQESREDALQAENEDLQARLNRVTDEKSRALAAEKKKRQKMAEELEVKNKRIAELEMEKKQETTEGEGFRRREVATRPKITLEPLRDDLSPISDLPLNRIGKLQVKNRRISELEIRRTQENGPSRPLLALGGSNFAFTSRHHLSPLPTMIPHLPLNRIDNAPSNISPSLRLSNLAFRYKEALKLKSEPR